MRGIKFRVWDKKEKEMSKSFSLQEVFKNDTSDANLRNCELMQFTGLLDKNGKEIYEGDILQLGEYGNDIAASVIFDAGRFRLDRQLILTPEKSEVIGNIYENPELLK